MDTVRASIVVATYNRNAPLARLLESLVRQTVPRAEFEVVVVDDGSAEEAAPAVAPFQDTLQVTVLRQKNGGAAVARQHGAEIARGHLLVFLDDDMLVGEDFLAQHLAAHEGHPDRVVLGRLLPAGEIAT